MCLSLFFRAGAWYLTARSALPRRDPPPPRLHLGDDDRRAHVGDAAGPPRRARPGDDHRSADRSLPRDVPGPARDPRLPDGLQHSRADRCSACVIVSSTDLFRRSSEHLFLVSFAPALLLVAVDRGAGAGPALGLGPDRSAGRDAARRRWSGFAPASRSSAILAAVRWRRPRSSPPGRSRSPPATRSAVAMGLDAAMGIGGAAAVLFAVNVTAVVPATPSNIGVFQLAVISVLTHRLRGRRGRRARLRRDPAGGRDRDRRRASAFRRWSARA